MSLYSFCLAPKNFLSNVLYDSLIFWRQIKKPGGMVAH